MADVLTSFISFLIEIDFSHPNEIILVGHSLGAHIAGLTGKRFVQERIYAIFGLDPAGPLFSIGNPNERLSANDAIYTEGIRTNAGDNGFDEPLCQSDFYPNWGQVQPGCGIDVRKSLKNHFRNIISMFRFQISGSCAHQRSALFFAESINSNRFIGVRCANYAQLRERKCPGSGDILRHFFMSTNANNFIYFIYHSVTGVMGGDAWSFGYEGVFFLETGTSSPFALG